MKYRPTLFYASAIGKARYCAVIFKVDRCGKSGHHILSCTGLDIVDWPLAAVRDHAVSSFVTQRNCFRPRGKCQSAISCLSCSIIRSFSVAAPKSGTLSLHLSEYV